MIVIGCMFMMLVGAGLALGSHFMFPYYGAGDYPTMALILRSDVGMAQSYAISGFILFFIGCFVLLIRMRQTGSGQLNELPQEDEIKVFFTPARSTNTKILKGKLMADNIIVAEGNIINYKGGGFRLAGHECIRCHGNVASNVPEWLGELIHRYKVKYKVKNIYEVRRLYDAIQKLDAEIPMSTQLEKIPMFAEIMRDDKCFNDICNTRLSDLKQLSETLWDGTTVNLPDDIDEFLQTATPATLHTYAYKEANSVLKRNKIGHGKTNSNMVTYVVVGLMIFMIAIGALIFLTGAGT